MSFQLRSLFHQRTLVVGNSRFTVIVKVRSADWLPGSCTGMVQGWLPSSPGAGVQVNSPVSGSRLAVDGPASRMYRSSSPSGSLALTVKRHSWFTGTVRSLIRYRVGGWFTTVTVNERSADWPPGSLTRSVMMNDWPSSDQPGVQVNSPAALICAPDGPLTTA